MRFCCAFRRVEEFSCPEQRAQPDGDAREGVRPTLLAVDDADRRSAFEARLAERVDSLDSSASRRDDVLDEADALTRREHALEPVAGSVALRLLAHDQERQP